MGRFILLLGIFLIIFAIAFMGLLFSPNVVPFVADTMVTVYCEAPETQITSGDRLNTGGTRNSSSVYFCEDEDGNRREITDSVGATAAIGFIVFLFSGILLTLGGLGRMGRDRRAKRKIARSQGGLASAGIVSEQQETVQNVYSTDETNNTNISLTERLQQLDDARKQGLISKQEYDRTRQSILDVMDDF